MTRSDELLDAAADLFLDGDSIGGDFLTEHDVTSTECGELTDRIGIVLKGFLGASRETQDVILLVGAARETPEIAEVLESTIRLKHTVQAVAGGVR